jgi:UDP-glucose 4-epimerase
MDIHAACELVTGTKIPFEITARRPGDPPALVADPQKLKSRLGWKPKYPDIKSVVETAWKWHQRYPNGYTDKATSR